MATSTTFKIKNSQTYATVTIGETQKDVLVYTRKDPSKFTERFKSLFKDRVINSLPENSPLVFNEHTKRFVKRGVMYTKKGALRSKFAKRQVYSNVVNYTRYYFEAEVDGDNNSGRLSDFVTSVQRDQVVFTTTRPFSMVAANLALSSLGQRKDNLVREFLNKPNIPLLRFHLSAKDTLDLPRLYREMTNNQFDELPFEKNIASHPVYPFIVEITSYSSTNIRQGDLDLRNVRMYNASVMIDNAHITKNFQDKGEMRCVPETLFYKYCDKTKTNRNLNLSIEQICEAMTIADDRVKKPEDGFTVNDLELFCKRYKIPMYALDMNERLFHSYYPETRSKKCSALCYIVANNHLYLCEDKAFVNRVNSFARPITSSSSSVMNETPEQEKTEIVIDEHNIVVKEQSLDTLFMDFYTNDNIIISPTNCYFQDGRIKKMVCDTNQTTYYANEDIDLVKQYIQNYNTRNTQTSILFTNQSVLGLGRQIFNTLYPDHKKSVFNQQVFDVFPVNANMVRKYNQVNNETQLVGIDINKCRTSCLRDNILGEYKRFCVMDSIEPYDTTNTELTPGFYRIKTTNELPAKGDGWYSNEFLKYLTQEHIEYTIELQLLSSFTYTNDYLKRFFEEITQLPEFKFISNGTIGGFAMRRKTSSKVYFETDFKTACAHYFNMDGTKKSNSEVYITPMDDDKTLYKIEDRMNHIELDSDIPIYNQILENEWIKCYELRKKMGGTLIAIKTDNVIVENANEVELTGEVGGYKVGDTHLPINDCKVSKPVVEMTFDDWKTDKESDFETFDDIAKHIVDKNQSCNIIGSAGVGKSYLIKKIETLLEGLGKRYTLLAPTNKAALNIGGVTIHKFLGMNHLQKIRKNMLRKLKSYEYIIIDEISMVGSMIYNQLNLAKQQNKRIKFLMLGDFKQLPPVGDDGYDYENTQILKQLCDYNRFELTKNKRSDDVMWNIATHAYTKGNIYPFTFGTHSKWESERHLCYTNRTRKGINEYIMRSKGPGLSVECTEKDTEQNEYAQSVVLHIGTPLMSCKNNKKEEILNNQSFTVTGWDDSVIHTCSMDIRIEDFHKMFVVAYAMTVHKSQGDTFDFKFSIWETAKMDHKMLYTAITRTTNKNLICIANNENELPFVNTTPKKTVEEQEKALSKKKKDQQVPVVNSQKTLKKEVIETPQRIREQNIIVTKPTPVVPAQPTAVDTPVTRKCQHCNNDAIMSFDNYVFVCSSECYWKRMGNKSRKIYDKDFILSKLNGYKQQDRNKDREFNLNSIDFYKLVNDDNNSCHFCGDDLVEETFTIDRVNNNLGHVKGNCRLACLRCNRKHGKTLNE